MATEVEITTELHYDPPYTEKPARRVRIVIELACRDNSETDRELGLGNAELAAALRLANEMVEHKHDLGWMVEEEAFNAIKLANPHLEFKE